MHIGFSGGPVGHAFGYHKALYAAQPQDMSRGEKLVARYDANGDGAIGMDELADTKLGRKMSVDHFARIDGDGDGALTAAEFDAARHGRRSANENAVITQIADHLAAKVTEDMAPEDGIAAKVMERLDADGSGALNSEEIAGTRLYEAIGNGFFALDADGSGTLDKAELSAFVVDYLTGGNEEPEEAEGETSVSASAAEDAEAPVVPVVDTPEPEDAGEDVGVVDDAVAETTQAAPSSTTTSVEAAHSLQIKSAFEAALEVLQSGQSEVSAYDAVFELHGQVQDILNA